MQALRSLKGELEGLFVFHAYRPCNWFLLKDVLIRPSVKLQHFLNDGAIMEFQLEELCVGVIYEAASAIGSVRAIAEGDFDDEPIDFICDFVVEVGSEQDGCDGVVSKDDVVPAGSVMMVFCDYSGSIVMQK